MRFMMMTTDDASSTGTPPSPEMYAEMGKLIEEMTKAGVLVRSVKLKPSATAKRLVFTSNDMRVLDGPFIESKELLGGFAVMELSDMDDAIGMCRRYAEILGGTLEIDARIVDTDA